jgi:hypothetical protein
MTPLWLFCWQLDDLVEEEVKKVICRPQGLEWRVGLPRTGRGIFSRNIL